MSPSFQEAGSGRFRRLLPKQSDGGIDTAQRFEKFHRPGGFNEDADRFGSLCGIAGHPHSHGAAGIGGLQEKFAIRRILLRTQLFQRRLARLRQTDTQLAASLDGGQIGWIAEDEERRLLLKAVDEIGDNDVGMDVPFQDLAIKYALKFSRAHRLGITELQGQAIRIGHHGAAHEDMICNRKGKQIPEADLLCIECCHNVWSQCSKSCGACQAAKTAPADRRGSKSRLDFPVEQAALLIFAFRVYFA